MGLLGPWAGIGGGWAGPVTSGYGQLFTLWVTNDGSSLATWWPMRIGLYFQSYNLTVSLVSTNAALPGVE